MPRRDYRQTSRQGVGADVRARILDVIDPASPYNPWKNRHARVRNQLIFLWLLLLGVRNGELLATYASDVNVRSGEVTIIRRPGNPEEQRSNAPLVKTRGRLLALGPDLAEMIKAYITGERAKIKGARRHPYLFVATGTGRPLSKPALNKLFRELRTRVPGLPDDLSPHVLRHTWNDDFSELMVIRPGFPRHLKAMENG
ncbi:tyrosine-type recombinase/integrase [Xanthomonas nasturtii]|uniref:tyrosine-type recombinase/integrase n=1 Tax=Xanthomonas nasturtii TaxID=1843581 RepID=UPI003CE47F92